MSYLSIEGGAPLHGELTIQGSKNSVLPVLAATILARDVCRIENCPRLRDVDASVAILRHLGCRVRRDGTALEVDTAPMARCDIPDELMREMRSSIIFLGAILARQGEAVLSYPGGCELGPRPIDLHLAALRELGAEITERYGELRCKAKCLRGTDITLAIPSVGATENAMMAAVCAPGETVIHNAAREPEIQDLARFLNACGAHVRGAGSGAVPIRGGARRRMELIWLHAEDAPSPSHLALSCRHCADPACLAVCPGDAIAKTEDGTVTVQEENCLDCRACADACPFDVPRFNEDSGVMEKCDLCRGLPVEGIAPPCAATCPTGALRLELVEREEKREAEQSLLTLLKERRGQSFPKEY